MKIPNNDAHERLPVAYEPYSFAAVIKTGSAGFVAYRLMTKDLRWLWLQTSAKVQYKNSKQDSILCTHRHLS